MLGMLLHGCLLVISFQFHVLCFLLHCYQLLVLLLFLLMLLPRPPVGSNTKLFMLDDASDDEETRPLGTPLIDAEAVAGAHPAAEAPTQASATRDSASGAATKAAIDDYQPITYNYSFFHLIFALASMYIAMLMTGWGAVEQEKDRLDVGWTSVWVKTGAEWVTALLYTWTLVAPALMPDRDWGY